MLNTTELKMKLPSIKKLTYYQGKGTYSQKKYATQKQIDEIDLRVKDMVKECEKFAEESSYPEKNIMYDSVYEQDNYPFLKHKI